MQADVQSIVIMSNLEEMQIWRNDQKNISLNIFVRRCAFVFCILLDRDQRKFLSNLSLEREISLVKSALEIPKISRVSKPRNFNQNQKISSIRVSRIVQTSLFQTSEKKERSSLKFRLTVGCFSSISRRSDRRWMNESRRFTLKERSGLQLWQIYRGVVRAGSSASGTY